MDRREETELTLKHVLEGQRPPVGVGEKIARKAYAERFGSTVRIGPRDVQFANTGILRSPMLPWFACAILAGVLIGGLSFSSESTSTSQLILAEILGRGKAEQGILTLASFVISTIRVLFLMILLSIASGSGFWQGVYPSRIPMHLNVTRIVVIFSILVGALQILAGGVIVVISFTQGVRLNDRSWYREYGFFYGLYLALEQVWWVIFWIASFLLTLAAIRVLKNVAVTKPRG